MSVIRGMSQESAALTSFQAEACIESDVNQDMSESGGHEHETIGLLLGAEN